jgi:hypothetical protein
MDIRIDELWWQRMSNAVMFISDVYEAIQSGKSVIMNFPDEIPWQDTLTEILIEKIRTVSAEKTVDHHDVSGVAIPGEYLMNNYCSEKDKVDYWFSISYEEFLSAKKNITLNHRYVFLTGINQTNAESWVKSVSDYLGFCNERQEHGEFILMVKHSNIKAVKNMQVFNYTDYVTDYDCLLLCLNIISSMKCSSGMKTYISEVASNIAGSDIEAAGYMAAEGIELVKEPLKTAQMVSGIQNLTEDMVTSAIWLAQIKMLFPKLEQLRKSLIQKHLNQIRSHLPYVGSDGERIDEPNALEIGELFSMCHRHKILGNEEFSMLSKMRSARNNLAHWKIMSYSDIIDLHIF